MKRASFWMLPFLGLLGMTASQPRVIIVAADGTGDVTTLQAALDRVPTRNTTPVTIQINPGRYYERIVIDKSKPFITLLGTGEKPGDVVIWYDLHARSVIPPSTQPVGTSGSTGFLIDAADFAAENLTFENPSGHIAQAVAVKINSDRVSFRNCRFIGGQDTLYPNGGKAYFADCYIEGRADFIFGRGTALFERCTLHSKNGGFVTAPSTNAETAFGFVFLDCDFTGSGEQKAYLGRPWRDHGMTYILRSRLGQHIHPQGWHHWQPQREATARFAEYQNTGPGAERSERVKWARQLTDEEAGGVTQEKILGGWVPPLSSKITR